MSRGAFVHTIRYDRSCGVGLCFHTQQQQPQQLESADQPHLDTKHNTGPETHSRHCCCCCSTVITVHHSVKQRQQEQPSTIRTEQSSRIVQFQHTTLTLTTTTINLKCLLPAVCPHPFVVDPRTKLDNKLLFLFAFLHHSETNISDKHE